MPPYPEGVIDAILAADRAAVERALDATPSLLETCWQDAYRPLHFAALYGAPEIVTLLLERGAEVNPRVQTPGECPDGDSNVWYDWAERRTREGWTPLDMALHAHFPEIAARLRAAGGLATGEHHWANWEWWHEYLASKRRR